MWKRDVPKGKAVAKGVGLKGLDFDVPAFRLAAGCFNRGALWVSLF
jgi:hypothetical protein